MRDRSRSWGREDWYLPLGAKQYRNHGIQVTLFKIHRVGIKLERNVVEGLGQLERKTKQTNNPFASDSRTLTLPGCDPTFRKPPNRAPFLDPCRTGYKEAGGHQP